MKTFSAKAHEVKRDWFVVDATDLVLGRLASEIAHRLRGKHKTIYTPHVDTGDYIVVINADKIKVTGNKDLDKLYHRHSGYPGGISTTTFGKMQGPLGYAMFRKMKVYAGDKHDHVAQQPKPLVIQSQA